MTVAECKNSKNSVCSATTQHMLHLDYSYQRKLVKVKPLFKLLDLVIMQGNPSENITGNGEIHFLFSLLLESEDDKGNSNGR